MGMLAPMFFENLPHLTQSPIRLEIARVTSPDGSEDAVLSEVHSAIVSAQRSSEVHVVRHGMPMEKGPLVFSANRLLKPEILWNDPRLLEIRYSRAHIDYFTSARQAAP